MLFEDIELLIVLSEAKSLSQAATSYSCRDRVYRRE